MRRVAWLVALVISATPIVAYAQPWAGILDPSRAIDWSKAGILGGIPNRATICASLNPGATHTQINNAIAACSNGVVFLNAGTYSLAGGIAFGGRSNVTLRGAGPDQTILAFTGVGDGCLGQSADICVRGSSQIWVGNLPAANIRNWTAGYAKGTTRITVDSTSGMSVGMVLILDQLNDTVDTGGIYICYVFNLCATETTGPAGRRDRAQQQYVQVTAISGTEVTISPGLYMPNWRSSQSPQVWWWGSISETATMNGIENLTIDHANSTAFSGIQFNNAYNGWVKNVKSLNGPRNHVWAHQAARIQVQDSYFYGTKSAASQSYGFEAFSVSDSLVINNIFQHVTTPIMMGTSVGCVIAYNYMIDMFYQVPTFMLEGISGSHDAGTGMSLFEGNASNGFIMDVVHGTGAVPTLFRNQLLGTEPGKSQNGTHAIIIEAGNRLANVVGNVLGTSGYHRNYENSRGPSGRTGDAQHSVYLLGYSAALENTPLPYDLLVVSTLLRWGNFDYATNAVRWNASEIPADNTVPESRALPPSLFLSARPSWWGPMPWPSIGPDVAGGQDPSGHVYDSPAKVCYNATPKDSNGILIFNAEKCYGKTSSGVAPSPPQNLRVQ